MLRGRKKIVGRVFGGIGNQLFGYAAARRLAIVNDADLVIDSHSGFINDSLYKRRYQLRHFKIPGRVATLSDRLLFFSRLHRYIKKKINYFISYNNKTYIQQEFIDFDDRLLGLKTKKSIYIEGYWQSELYFKDIESTIRSDLLIIPPTDKNNIEISMQVQDCSAVALHIRFFDSLDENLNSNSNASNDYYLRAIEHIESKITNAHYFIFSDNPGAAASIVPLSQDRYTLVSNNEGDENAYADLWLMSLCKHFIIANSTFSWWGAWLSNNPKKIVIAPGFEKREGKSAWGFYGLLPDNWIKL